MQSASEEGNTAPYDQPPPADEATLPFSDAFPLLDIPDIVSELVSLTDTRVPRQAAPQNNPPSSFQPPSSSHDELDSLLRHAEEHGELLISLRSAVSSFMRRYNRFAPLRAENLLLRSRMEFEWTVCADQRRFVAESHERFMREATAFGDSLATQPSAQYQMAKLLSAHAQVARDHQRQAEHLVRTYDTETQQSKLEYSLQQKEYRLAQAAQRIFEVLEHFDLPDHGVSEPSEAPSVINQEEDVPALVQYYFDKAGDVGLARDNIIELELDHREERERRDLQEDQGVLLSMSEEEFEETFRKQLVDAETGLVEALRRADNAKQVCIDADLDPELYRNRLRPDPTAGSDHSISDDQAFEEQDSSVRAATPLIAPSISTLAVGNANSSQVASQVIPQERSSTVISDPTDLIIPESLSLQDIPSAAYGQGKDAPIQDRIKVWMEDVTADAGDLEEALVEARETQTISIDNGEARTASFRAVPIGSAAVDIKIARSLTLSRSKSSETHNSPPVLEYFQDGTWKVNKAASHHLREQRRRESLRDVAVEGNTTSNGEVRPSLHTRTSSESKVMVLPSWEGSYRDAVDNIRGLATAIE